MNSRIACAALTLLVLACASSSPSKPAAPEPELLIQQISNIPEAARYVTGRISVQYAVAVKNVTPAALQLKRIDVQSIGYGAYTLAPTSLPFDVAIAPGETRVVQFWGGAFIDTSTIMGANGPVTLRAVAQFDSANGPVRTTVVQQVHETGFSD
ncbi:MAG TPA: hypothetical protein VIO12_02855 [Thermoanaerobaculia bacterium]|jgi:hypothetical protein